MKKGIITMMALMLGISGMMAQNTVVVAGSGDVSLKHGEVLEVRCEGQPITFSLDGKTAAELALKAETFQSVGIEAA